MIETLKEKRSELIKRSNKILSNTPNIVGYHKYLTKEYYNLDKEIQKLTAKINEMEEKRV